MPSTYTVNLGIEKPATGEQSGTWGDTTNVNFDILDQAVNGAARVTLTSAGSSGSPNTLAITNGATSDGRNKWVEFYSSGDLGGNVFVQLDPNDAEKIVFVRNSLASSRSILLFQGTYNSGRDLEIPAGVDMVVKFDGGGASAATVTDVFTKLRATEITTPTLTGGTVVASTSLNIAGDGATVTGIKDEDNMASNSATKLATQQSIKAYVDSQVGTVDTLAEILANGNTTGGTDIAVSANDDITFTDSSKAIFGAGSDLQIYHDGSHSRIDEQGTGVLFLQTNGNNIQLNKGTSENMLVANVDGSVDLYYDNSKKLATTATGIDVTGTAVTDGLTVQATSGSSTGVIRSAAGSNSTLYLDTQDTTSLSYITVSGSLGIATGSGTPERMRISAAGDLELIQSNNLYWKHAGGGTIRAGITADSADNLKFSTGSSDSTAMTIDTSQRVLIGGQTTVPMGGTNFSVQLQGSSFATTSNVIQRYGDSSAGGMFAFAKSRNATIGSQTIVQDDDQLGKIRWYGSNGSNFTYYAAEIAVDVDGAPSSGADMPGRIVFSTTADGAGSPTERMRISNNGISTFTVRTSVGGPITGVSPDAAFTVQNAGADIGKITAVFGADENNNSLTNNTNKEARVGIPHYATAEEPPTLFYTSSTSSENQLTIGGGTSRMNAMTSIRFRTASNTNTVTGTEAMRIDSSQRVLMGTGTGATSTITNGWWNGSTSYSGILNVQNVNDGSAQKYVSLAVSRHSNDAEAGQLGFAKSRGATANSKTTVGNGDTLGLITFQGADGSNFVEAARITGSTDNTASGDEMPGRLQFYTTAVGAASPTERFRIDSSGDATFKTGGMNLKLPYNSTTNNSANLSWGMLQLGNNGANRLIGGNTQTGGAFEFVVNNTVDLSSSNSGSHNGLMAMSIGSGGAVEMHTPDSGLGLYINNTTHDSILQIQASAANKNSVIRFADGDDADVGLIDYDHNDDSMDLTTNALNNGLEISAIRGKYSFKSIENYGTSNYNFTPAPGVVFQRKGIIGDDVKIRVFQGGYTYTGGSIEFVIRKNGGTQTSVGSGVIYFNGRESEDNHVIVGYNESSQIVVNADTYAGTYADGKFTFAIRGTNGDSHITVMNRLGSEVYMALKFNILYTG